LIFAVLAAFIFIFSLADKAGKRSETDYKPVKMNKKVKIAWIVLVIIMLGLYIFFN
jgi:SSS family solute:Na+ symporter